MKKDNLLIVAASAVIISAFLIILTISQQQTIESLTTELMAQSPLDTESSPATTPADQSADQQPLSVVTASISPPQQITNLLSTADWKTVSDNGVSFKIPPELSCRSGDENDCGLINNPNATPPSVPFSIIVANYDGGSRRQYYLNRVGCGSDSWLIEEIKLGSVNALQLISQGDNCYGHGVIIAVIGNKIVTAPGPTIDSQKNIIRSQMIDTIVSTLK